MPISEYIHIMDKKMHTAIRFKVRCLGSGLRVYGARFRIQGFPVRVFPQFNLSHALPRPCRAFARCIYWASKSMKREANQAATYCRSVHIFIFRTPSMRVSRTSCATARISTFGEKPSVMFFKLAVATETLIPKCLVEGLAIHRTTTIIVTLLRSREVDASLHLLHERSD